MVEYTLPSENREQLIHEIALDLNSKGYNMCNRHDTLTGK